MKKFHVVVDKLHFEMKYNIKARTFTDNIHYAAKQPGTTVTALPIMRHMTT